MSKELKKYQRWLKSRAPIVPAQFLNTSGIVGTAMHAADRARARRPQGRSGWAAQPRRLRAPRQRRSNGADRPCASRA